MVTIPGHTRGPTARSLDVPDDLATLAPSPGEIDIETIFTAFTDWDHVARCVRGPEPSRAMAMAGLRHPAPEIRRHAAEHLRDVPEAMAIAAEDSRSEVRAVAAASLALDPERLAAFVSDRSFWVRLEAVRHVQLTAQARACFLDDPHVTVRVNAATRDLPDEVLERLPDHHCDAVRVAATRRRSLPDRLAHRLASDPDPSVRYNLAHRVTDPELLERFATDADPAVQRAAAQNSACPASALAITARSASSEVRQMTARHPSTSPMTMRELARHPDQYTRRGVARHTTDVEVLSALAGDRSLEVRLAVVDNPATTIPDLIRLSSSRSGRLIIAIARRDDVPAALHDDLIGRLRDDPRHGVRAEARREGLLAPPRPAVEPVAASDLTAVLEALDARSPAGLVAHVPTSPDAALAARLAVMDHRDLPEDVITAVAEDPRREMRAAAANHWNCPNRALRRLGRDPVPRVREIANRHLSGRRSGWWRRAVSVTGPHR